MSNNANVAAAIKEVAHKVFGGYAELLRMPHTARFSIGSVIACMPFPMVGMTITISVQHYYGNYSLAGVLTAIQAIALAVSSPLLGKLVDKFGQRQVSIPTILVWIVAAIALTTSITNRAPVWVLYCLTPFLAAIPPWGAMSRARWTTMLKGDRERTDRALSLSGVFDECMWIIGNPLASTLAVISGLLAFSFTGVCVVIGALMFIGVYLFRIYVLAEYQRGQNADLPAGIAAVNVCGGVTLCIAQLLCQCQCIIKTHLVAEHLLQNEVGGTVQNAGNCGDVIGSQTGVQRTNDRDRTADAGFEEEVHVMCLCHLQQNVAFFSNQLLIGSGNALAGFQTTANEVKRRIDTAHALCHVADLRIVENHLNVVYHAVTVRIIRKFPQIQNISYFQLCAGIFFDFLLIAVEQFHNTGTDYAITQYCNFLHYFTSSKFQQTLRIRRLFAGQEPHLYNALQGRDLVRNVNGICHTLAHFQIIQLKSILIEIG